MNKKILGKMLIMHLVLCLLVFGGCGNASVTQTGSDMPTSNGSFFEAEYIIDEESVQTNYYITRLIFYEDGRCWYSTLNNSEYWAGETSRAIQEYSVGKKTKTIAIGTAGLSGGILFTYSDDMQNLETEGYSLQRVK